jgi:hypothetical protein
MENENDQTRDGETTGRGDGQRPDRPGLLELRRAYPALAMMDEALRNDDWLENYECRVDPETEIQSMHGPIVPVDE